MEEKWKQNNPLPPSEIPLYKVLSEEKVEVEANYLIFFSSSPEGLSSLTEHAANIIINAAAKK